MRRTRCSGETSNQRVTLYFLPEYVGRQDVYKRQQCMLIVTINYPETSTIFIDRFLATAEAYLSLIHIYPMRRLNPATGNRTNLQLLVREIPFGNDLVASGTIRLMGTSRIVGPHFILV